MLAQISWLPYERTEGVPVDVDALDDAAVLSAIDHLVPDVLGLVQNQGQRFRRSRLPS